MLRILTALALVFALTGCVTQYPPNSSLYYTPPQPAQSTPTPQDYDPNFDATYSAETDLTSDNGTTTLEAPQQPATAQPTADLPAPEGAMLAQQRAACTREGGQFMPRGTGLYACVHRTQDAGRQCDEGSDCEGVCLARSRTCAPMQPLYGCQEVFTTLGRTETLCTE